MADPLLVATRQAIATERSNRLLTLIDRRLARIESRLKIDPASEPDPAYLDPDAAPEDGPGVAAAAQWANVARAIDASTRPDPRAAQAADAARERAAAGHVPPAAQPIAPAASRAGA